MIHPTSLSRFLRLGTIAIALAGVACTSQTGSLLPARAVAAGETTTGARIDVAIDPAALRVQARLAKQPADVTFYEVELIKDQGSAAGDDYSNAIMGTGGRIVGSVFLDGSAAAAVPGTLTDSGTPGLLAFTNVVPGTYRVRVRAKTDLSTPGSTVINKPDNFFTNADDWAVSENTATVTDGSNVVLYSTPDFTRLTVDVPLLDGLGDTAPATVTVTNGRTGDTTKLAPDDPGPATAIHPYPLTVGAVTSDFVWIPTFSAYQLLIPANCGGNLHNGVADNMRPGGYWVNTQPATGTQGTDWAKETFGGFYAAKYEASHADATASTGGSATTLAVRPNVVPWDSVNWDQASQTCQTYHPAAHLMTDDEWTALAVYALINAVTVQGNNNSNPSTPGDTAGGFTCTVDPIVSGRALTGSGIPAQNASHDGTSVGVMDLNGNLAEWTASLSVPPSSPNWGIDDFITPVSMGIPGSGIVIGQETLPSVRRYGIPVWGPGPSTDFDSDAVHIPAVANPYKVCRGGTWSEGTGAGLWNVNLSLQRNYTGNDVGFRPALRFQ